MKELLRDLPYDDYYDEIENKDDYMYEITENNNDNYIYLLSNVIKKIEEVLINDKTLKKDEIIVGESIINILKNWDILFLEDIPDSKYYQDNVSKKYAKNKILLLMKEQTRLSTKEIRQAMKPYSDIYFLEKANLFDE